MYLDSWDYISNWITCVHSWLYCGVLGTFIMFQYFTVLCRKHFKLYLPTCSQEDILHFQDVHFKTKVNRVKFNTKCACLVVGCCYVDARFQLCTTDLDQQVEADPSLLEKYLRGEESPRSHIHGGQESPGPHIHSHSSYSSVVITRRPDGVRALAGIFHSS